MKVIFNHERVSCIIGIDWEALSIPEAVHQYATAHGLLPKSELHLTAISFGQAKQILRRFEELGLSLEQQAGIKKHILEKAENIDWTIVPSGIFHHLKKSYRLPHKTNEVQKESVVEPVTCNGLEQFISYINELLSLDLEGFGHITLFVKSSDSEDKTPGIAVNSEDELKSLIIQTL